MKGTIEISFFHPQFHMMKLFIDYEILSVEGKIELTNPQIQIPSGGSQKVDARMHPEWRKVLQLDHIQNDISVKLAQEIGVQMTFLKIDMKDLYS